MRFYYALIGLVIVIASAIGYLVISLKAPESFSNEDLIEISQLKRDFQKSISPLTIVNFSSIYSTEAQQVLLDPLSDMKNVGDKNKSIYSTDNDCF